MRAIDTNVLVRLITGDDLRQLAAAEAFVEGGAWVPLLALAETIWLLGTVYQLPPREQATAVEMLLNHKDLTLQDPDVAMTALELFRTQPNLGFSDCLILHSARKAGHPPLGTFDGSLGRINGTQKL